VINDLDIAKAKIWDTLFPILKQLIEDCPQYGEIILGASICDYKAGSIFYTIKKSKKVLRKPKECSS